MKDKFQTVKVQIKPRKDNKFPTNGDISLKLSGGQSLGMIQAFKVNASVDALPNLVIDTILTEAELEILQSQTELRYKILKDSNQKIKEYQEKL